MSVLGVFGTGLVQDIFTASFECRKKVELPGQSDPSEAATSAVVAAYQAGLHPSGGWAKGRLILQAIPLWPKAE